MDEEIEETLFDPDDYLSPEVLDEDVPGVTHPVSSYQHLGILGTRELSDHLQVSTAWVKRYAKDLGGKKDRNNAWLFDRDAITRAWELKLRQALTIGVRNEVVFRCRECGEDTVVQKGLMRRVLHEVKRCLVCQMGLPEAPFGSGEWDDEDAARSYENELRAAVEAEAIRRGEVRS